MVTTLACATWRDPGSRVVCFLHEPGSFVVAALDVEMPKVDGSSLYRDASRVLREGLVLRYSNPTVRALLLLTSFYRVE